MTDSKEHILYNKEEAEKGKFAFTTDDQDMFEICFVSKKEGNGFSRGNFMISIRDPRRSVPGGPWFPDFNKIDNPSTSKFHFIYRYSDAKAHEIKIDVKKGIEAKNYDEQVKRYYDCSGPFTFVFRPKPKN